MSRSSGLITMGCNKPRSAMLRASASTSPMSLRWRLPMWMEEIGREICRVWEFRLEGCRCCLSFTLRPRLTALSVAGAAPFLSATSHRARAACHAAWAAKAPLGGLSFRFGVRRHRLGDERPPSISNGANLGQDLLSPVFGHFALGVCQLIEALLNLRPKLSAADLAVIL